MGKRKTPFAVDKDGTRLYVLCAAVMPMVIAFAENIPLTFFGQWGEGPAYLTIDQAIEWTERECLSCPAFREKYGNENLALLREARTAFAAGAMREAEV